MAAIRFVITGTHKGDLETSDGVLHATNRPIKVDGIEYLTFNRQGSCHRSTDRRGSGRPTAATQGDDYRSSRS